MIVACVLKSGGDFKPEHVEHLRENLWGTVSFQKIREVVRFTCLTDMEVSVHSKPLTEDLPGWWSQIELFKPGQFDDKVLYMDIDTVLMKDISDYFKYDGKMCFLKDPIYKRSKRVLSSGLMCWDPVNKPDLPKRLWEEYKGNKEFYKEKRKKEFLSQTFFEKVLGKKQDTFQDLWPGTVVSYKEHCCNNWREKKFTGVPDGAKVVHFHGKPRPWDTFLWDLL